MPKNSTPTGPLSIRLTEPLSFLRGTATGEDGRGRQIFARTDAPPAMLRGLLTLRLNKPTRIRKIEIKLEGKARTEWPEGIGPRRIDTSEENVIIQDAITFYSAAEAQSRFGDRRAMSVGPGSFIDVEHDLDEDDEDDDEDEGEDEGDMTGDLGGPDGGRGRTTQRAGGMRSVSAFVGEGGRLPADTPVVPTNRAVRNLLEPEERRGRSNPWFPRDLLERERGPSPAYSPRDPMRLSLGTRPRASSFRLDPANPNGPPVETVLSPITSEPPSMSSSQVLTPSTPGAGTNGRTPVRPAVPSNPSEGDIASINLANFSFTDPVSPTAPLPDSPAPEDDSDVRSRFSSSRPGTSSGQSTGMDTPPTNPASPTAARMRGLTDSDSASSRRVSAAEQWVSVSRPGSRQSTVVEQIPSPAASIHEGHEGHGSDHQPHWRRESREGSVGSSLLARSHLHLGHGHGPAKKPSVSQLGQAQRSASGSSAGNHGEGSSSDGRRSSSKHFFTSAFRGFSRSRSKAPSDAGSDATQTQTQTRGPNASRSPHPVNGRMLSPGVSDEVMPFGRGGAARSPSRPRRRAESPAGSGDRSRGSRSASGSRGRTGGLKALGALTDDGKDGGNNWKEFKKGVYNYPISFSMPASLPPTIHADFGSIVYKLKATVHRVGALSPNYIEEQEVILIASPPEDDMEESENIIVERQWEEQMRYVIALSGKLFPIGGQIPVSIRIMPMSKCSLYRLSATIEEKIDYYAMDKKVARHEAVKKYSLLALKGAEKPHVEPLLPILSAAPDAFMKSPLAPYAYLAREGNESADDAAAALLNPTGPWHIDMNLQVPDCAARLRFSTKHATQSMTVSHWLKVVMRMERGDDKAVDSKGKRKQFDIIIETPLHLLDCRVNNQWNSLPTYARSAPNTAGQGTGVVCRMHGIGGPAPAPGSTPSSSPRPPPTRNGVPEGLPPASVVTSSSSPHLRGRATEIQEVEGEDSLLERNIVFDRLVSGQQSEMGEAPPTYDEALKRRSRSRSKAATVRAGRSGSLLGIPESRIARGSSPHI